MRPNGSRRRWIDHTLGPLQILDRAHHAQMISVLARAVVSGVVALPLGDMGQAMFDVDAFAQACAALGRAGQHC